MVVFLPGKDWFSCLLDGDDNLVDIIDFDPLYICENNGPAIRRQFPYAGDFWLIWTDADPATHTTEQIAQKSRSRGVVYIHASVEKRELPEPNDVWICYTSFCFRTVEDTILAFLDDPFIPQMPAAVQALVREKLRDRVPLS
jgi:hypothetical protein